MTTAATVELAAIDWGSLAEWADSQPASRSEHRILGIVLSLAGQPADEPLNELISGLDATNVTRVLNAIAHCAGWHERRWSANINGLPGG